jgi:hypothetical protein
MLTLQEKVGGLLVEILEEGVSKNQENKLVMMIDHLIEEAKGAENIALIHIAQLEAKTNQPVLH